MHPIQRQFAARLRQLREERGLTQLALAASCGWAVQKISLYERCLRSPSLNDLARLSEVLDVRISDLIGEANEQDDPLELELRALRAILHTQPLSVVRTVVRMARALVAQTPGR